MTQKRELHYYNMWVALKYLLSNQPDRCWPLRNGETRVFIATQVI